MGYVNIAICILNQLSFVDHGAEEALQLAGFIDLSLHIGKLLLELVKLGHLRRNGFLLDPGLLLLLGDFGLGPSPFGTNLQQVDAGAGIL